MAAAEDIVDTGEKLSTIAFDQQEEQVGRGTEVLLKESTFKSLERGSDERNDDYIDRSQLVGHNKNKNSLQ